VAASSRLLVVVIVAQSCTSGSCTKLRRNNTTGQPARAGHAPCLREERLFPVMQDSDRSMYVSNPAGSVRLQNRLTGSAKSLWLIDIS
jgi:hypothetical protein